MKLNEDVSRDMLLDVVEWYLEDLAKEQQEAKADYEQDKTDELQYAISTAFQLAREMLESRLRGLEE